MVERDNIFHSVLLTIVSGFVALVVVIPTLPFELIIKGVGSVSVPSSLALKVAPVPALVAIKTVPVFDAPVLLALKTVPVFAALFPDSVTPDSVPVNAVAVEPIAKPFPDVMVFQFHVCA